MPLKVRGLKHPVTWALNHITLMSIKALRISTTDLIAKKFGALSYLPCSLRSSGAMDLMVPNKNQTTVLFSLIFKSNLDVDNTWRFTGKITSKKPVLSQNYQRKKTFETEVRRQNECGGSSITFSMALRKGLLFL